MIYSTAKRLNWLFGFALLVFVGGCGQTSQNQLAVNDSRNQAVVKTEPDRKFESDAALQEDADALLPLFDRMPSVFVYVRDEPVLKVGTNTEKAVAYTQCDVRRVPTVFVKKIFYQKANRKQLVNILKHEMTHAWLCRQGVPWGHDAAFRRKFQQIGGFGN